MPIRVKKLASNINFFEHEGAIPIGLSQSEENKCLLGILFGAGRPRRYVPTVMVPVVIFGGKNKCDKPKIGVYHVNCHNKEADFTRYEHRNKGR